MPTSSATTSWALSSTNTSPSGCTSTPNELLRQDGITYEQIDGTPPEGQEILAAIKEEAIEQLGYFLRPSELFHAIAERGAVSGETAFILEDLTRILKNIEQSTMGTESEDDFDHLFEDLDLTSTKLGRTEARNDLIVKVLSHLDKIDFKLDRRSWTCSATPTNTSSGKFASGAGKKAGEFYTPQEVSKILASW
jgi:type I restriction enzyme M protein